MKRATPSSPTSGFSLVELMVALLFIGLLMAGMSRVFASGISSFMTTNETLTATRTGRWALDALYDDVNLTCGFSTNVWNLPGAISNGAGSIRPFMIYPNQPVVLAGADANDPTSADHLYVTFDQPLFESTISAWNQAADGSVTFTVTTDSLSQAALVTAGCVFVAQDTVPVKDAWNPFLTAVSVSTAGNTVTVVTAPSTGLAESSISGAYQGTAAGIVGAINPAAAKTRILAYMPLQTVRYSIKGKKLDPSQPTKEIPCLVREQGNYPGTAAFAPVAAKEQIIAEQVQNFKVYLSADGGSNWAGLNPLVLATGEGGWSAIANAIDGQLSAKGIWSSGGVNTVKYQTIQSTVPGQVGWFRDFPLRVRIDLTTRTAVKRSEYATGAATSTNATRGTAANPVAAYRTRTTTLMLSPSHSGLPYN